MRRQGSQVSMRMASLGVSPGISGREGEQGREEMEMPDGPEPAAAWKVGMGPEPPSHCSLATPGAPLFAHGCKHLANIGSWEVIHLVALKTAARR